MVDGVQVQQYSALERCDFTLRSSLSSNSCREITVTFGRARILRISTQVSSKANIYRLKFSQYCVKDSYIANPRVRYAESKSVQKLYILYFSRKYHIIKKKV